MTAALRCQRCGDPLRAAVGGGPRWTPLLICPRYRWWHLFLHTVIALGAS